MTSIEMSNNYKNKYRTDDVYGYVRLLLLEKNHLDII